MSKKIIFMGTPYYATIIFEKLLNSTYEILSIFTQPDKPVGRKQILTPPHIKQFCIDKNLKIPIYQPAKLKDNLSTYVLIKDINPDFIVVAAYGQILPKEILDICPCINLHASLLPKYRGASPIQESLLNDDKYIGITSMLMNEGLDSGKILAYKYFKTNLSLDINYAFEILAKMASDLIIKTLDNYNIIQPKKQNEICVSFCNKIKKEDGIIEFDDSKKIFLKYKSYLNWPGVFLKSGLKLKNIELVESVSINEKGKILEIDNNSIIVSCLKGTIRINTLQSPSKKEICSNDYIKGQRLKVGDFLI